MSLKLMTTVNKIEYEIADEKSYLNFWRTSSKCGEMRSAYTGKNFDGDCLCSTENLQVQRIHQFTRYKVMVRNENVAVQLCFTLSFCSNNSKISSVLTYFSGNHGECWTLFEVGMAASVG